MKRFMLAVLASVAVMAGSPEACASGQWSVGAGVSTLGLGAEVGYAFNKKVKLRGTLSGWTMNRSYKDAELSVKGDLRLLTVGLLGDWHVAENGFRLTGGLVYNGNRLRMHGTPSQNLHIYGRTYTPAEIGEARATFDFRRISPYLGIGYDSGHGERGWSFNADLGVLFQGKIRGKVDSLTGTLRNRAQVISDVKDDITGTINSNKWVRTYPVMRLGLSYKF